jgi:hypothetical protein
VGSICTFLEWLTRLFNQSVVKGIEDIYIYIYFKDFLRSGEAGLEGLELSSLHPRYPRRGQITLQ